MDKIVNLISKNLDMVKERIVEAALSVGRSSNAVKLVVVSKGQPADIVRAAIEAGIKSFGENYPEETFKKIKDLGNIQGIEWHMIGHLQSRKSEIVAENFSVFHSLDSVHLAMKLDRVLNEKSRKLPVMLECNISGENTKYGWPAWEENQWKLLIKDALEIIKCKSLIVVGLMTMPPLFQDVEDVRPYFQKLRALKEYLSNQISSDYFKELSMGTSIDYPIAIQEGATYIRIGQAILGQRQNILHVETNIIKGQDIKED
jgi:PLP dependent protein